jgi:peptidoglycan-associated lipoprotein
MNVKKITTVFALCAITIGLTACSNAHKPAGVEDAYNNVGSNNNGVETAGLGAEGQYRGEAVHGDWMDAPTRQVAQQLGISDNTVYFSFDRSEVDGKYNYIIQANANYLKTHPSAHVRLEGNTDPRGSREYNIGLGQRRSDRVQQRLLALGVSPRQMTTVSYGQEKLAVAGDGESAYALDRRVNITYTQVG